MSEEERKFMVNFMQQQLKFNQEVLGFIENINKTVALIILNMELKKC